MDFEDLERKVKDPDNKLLILSNPHNPVGRAWTAEELTRLGDLCAENGVLLISDEIHADLMMKGVKHTSVGTLSEKIKKNTIVHYAPSKTFNLAGLQTAYAVIPNNELREKYIKGLNANRIFNMNWFGSAALEAAYDKSGNYVDALCDYVNDNMDYMVRYVQERLPMLHMKKSEATYMVWVDFRGTGMSTEEIESFIDQKAHIGVDKGSWFGPGGEGYLRFNLACPRKILDSAPTGAFVATQTRACLGRQSRLIMPPAMRNRAFPTGNALLYISLSYVDFGRVRPAGHTLFLFCPQSSNP